MSKFNELYESVMSNEATNMDDVFDFLDDISTRNAKERIQNLIKKDKNLAKKVGEAIIYNLDKTDNLDDHDQHPDRLRSWAKKLIKGKYF
jgi:hypothetical protein